MVLERIMNTSPRSILAASWGLAFLGMGTPALAHIDLEDVGGAGERQVLNFTVGHGCTGSDTLSVEIRIPEEVTSVRAVPWAYGDGEVVTSSSGAPLAVVWTKSAVREVDDQFYTLSMRITVPDLPFSHLYFPAYQTCRSIDGEVTVVEWVGLPGDPENPAPELRIIPVRHAGWNRFTPTASVTDLSVFDDAEIVWQGEAAYSANPTIMELIEGEGDVAVLTELTAGSEVWVKY